MTDFTQIYNLIYNEATAFTQVTKNVQAVQG